MPMYNISRDIWYCFSDCWIYTSIILETWSVDLKLCVCLTANSPWRWMLYNYLLFFIKLVCLHLNINSYYQRKLHWSIYNDCADPNLDGHSSHSIKILWRRFATESSWLLIDWIANLTKALDFNLIIRKYKNTQTILTVLRIVLNLFSKNY